MKLNCVITDDEPVALEIIEDYVKAVPELHLTQTCQDALETASALRKEKVDILFLDIHLPEINGLEFIKTMKERPIIIITTAYPKYAVEGFELDVLDYLLKPVSFHRFLKTVDKIFSYLGTYPKGVIREIKPVAESKHLFLKSKGEYLKVTYDEILFFESLQNYVKVICESRTIIVHSTIKQIEFSLPADLFFRVHRSYVVNIEKVELFSQNMFKIKDHAIPIGNKYKKQVLDTILNTKKGM